MGFAAVGGVEGVVGAFWTCICLHLPVLSWITGQTTSTSVRLKVKAASLVSGLPSTSASSVGTQQLTPSGVWRRSEPAVY